MNIRLIGLGTSATSCRAALGFRLAETGEAVGPNETVFLKLGERKKISLPLDSFGAGDGGRVEVRPFVESADPLSNCFPSVDLTQDYGLTAVALVSAASLVSVRAADALYAPFVDASKDENVRLSVARVEVTEGETPPCSLRVGFRDAEGKSLNDVQVLTLNPGAYGQITLPVADLRPAGEKKRVLLDVRPAEDRSAAGCAVAAEVFKASNGRTVKYAPIAVGSSTDQLAVPPAKQNGETPPTLPPVGGPVPIGQPISIRLPLGLPPVPFPADNPPTAETIALGRRLFYDKSLSADRTVSCASCHDPAAGFADPRRVSLGVNGADGDRNSMSVLNAAYSPEVFWEGRAKGLEAQAREPVRSAVELAHSLDSVEQRLRGNPRYVTLFEQAFGPGPISYDMAAKSIAAFQRTLLSGNSPFDRFYFGGQRDAISVSASRGFTLFVAVGCSRCHSLESSRYATFGNERFFNTGVAAIAFDRLSDQGRWNVTWNEVDRGAFRPPTLRNIVLTAPYMHNGNFLTLHDVVQFYIRGGQRNAWLSPEMIPAAANVPLQDIDDLVAFLQSLTGETPENAGPPEDDPLTQQ